MTGLDWFGAGVFGGGVLASLTIWLAVEWIAGRRA